MSEETIAFYGMIERRSEKALLFDIEATPARPDRLFAGGPQWFPKSLVRVGVVDAAEAGEACGIGSWSGGGKEIARLTCPLWLARRKGLV